MTDMKMAHKKDVGADDGRDQLFGFRKNQSNAKTISKGSAESKGPNTDAEPLPVSGTGDNDTVPDSASADTHADQSSASVEPSPSCLEAETPSLVKSANRHARGGGHKLLGIEHAASHLLGAATGWLFMAVARAVRGKQRRMQVAQGELEAARALLAAREAALEAASGQLKEAADRELAIQGLVQEQASAAESALVGLVAAANTRCQEAAANLERTMNDLKVTQSELMSARSQLQSAMDEMASVRQRGEAAEGELGLTRSENELLRRELQRMRSQLEGASHALERHRQGVRAANNNEGWEEEGLTGGAWVGVDDASSLGGYGSEDDRL